MLVAIVLLFLFEFVNCQEKWCGKNYKKDTPVIKPGGHFPTPPIVSDPRLLFRCSPAIKPYIKNDDNAATILVDLEFTHLAINDTSPLPTSINNNPRFLVRVFTDVIPLLTAGTLSIGTNQKLHFPLFALSARHNPYSISCTAQLIGGESNDLFEANTSLFYLPPNPHGGSVVKTDIETKSLLVKNAGKWSPFIPFGFYTSFDNYLAGNLSVLDAAVEKGYNLVHPVPTFGNLTALEEVLDYMEELGLWLMYDMRWSYKNEEAVREEVNRIKRRKNLLLWYTADEPDGWTDTLDAPKRAYDQINELDGYHPISLVLNCEDFHFREYITGADIILQDTYPIAINATYSTIYDTPCTPDYGDCGCDNCVGDGIQDVIRRLDGFYNRLYWDGNKGVAVWSVVQAFGNQSFWNRYPTGREFVAQAIVSLNHGARGIVPWVEPTSDEITSSASLTAKTLPFIRHFLLDPHSKFHVPDSIPVSVDIATWTLGDLMLVLATNLHSSNSSLTLIEHARGLIATLVDEGGKVRISDDGVVDISLDELGSLAFIVQVYRNI